MCGGEEGFEDAGDDQHGNCAGEEADGLAAGEGESVATTKHAREEKTRGETETGASGDEDTGELERTVGGDEAPDAEGHVVLGAGGGDDAHVDAVGEHEKDGSETGEDAACVGVEANGDVVGHDLAGGLGLGGEDGVGPHLVVLDLVDHLRTKHGVHELGSCDGEEGSQQRSCEKDGEGDRCVGEQAAKDSRIAAREEVPDAGEAHAVAGVDTIMGAADEAVQVCFEGAGGLIGPDGGEVGCGLAVEEAELAQFWGGESFEAGCFDLLDEGFEAAPTIFAQCYPVI